MNVFRLGKWGCESLFRVPALSLGVIILCAGLSFAADAIKPGETLDLKRCIEIALERHPALTSAAGTLDASRSRVSQAKAGYYPRIDLSTGYERTHPASGSGSAAASDDEYQGRADLSQTIYDFGRTSSSVKVNSLFAESSRADYEDTANRVVFNVKQAYYELSKSRKDRDALAETVLRYEKHLDQAKRFYEAGIRPKIDVTMSEVDLGRARLDILKAENALRIARIALNNAMGVPAAPAYEILDEAGIPDYAIDLEAALERGFKSRPDLLSAQAQREAAERSVDLARTGYYPILSGSAGYGWTGEEFPLEREWSLGTMLTFPLFNGFSTRHRVQEARAGVDVYRGNEEVVRQNVRYEIEQAFYNVREARERITLAELLVRHAQQNRELAQGRYAEEVGNTIEVTDALVAEVDAKAEYITALYDYRIAVANLEKAMGGR